MIVTHEETSVLDIMKSITKVILPEPVLATLSRLRSEFRSRIIGVPTVPPGTDLVGYETLIQFIQLYDILAVEGDLVDIGAFLGGGTCKLSIFLERRRSPKRLYAIDVFDPTFDRTANTDGTTMASLYLNILGVYEGKSQWEIFQEVTKGCKNVVILKGDSRNVRIPCKMLCFGFIDGHHDPEYVENDFYLIWDRLSSRGAVAFHDYEWDLPQTTATIEKLVARHAREIQETHHDKNKHILFIIRK